LHPRKTRTRLLHGHLRTRSGPRVTVEQDLAACFYLADRIFCACTTCKHRRKPEVGEFRRNGIRPPLPSLPHSPAGLVHMVGVVLWTSPSRTGALTKQDLKTLHGGLPATLPFRYRYKAILNILTTRDRLI